MSEESGHALCLITELAKDGQGYTWMKHNHKWYGSVDAGINGTLLAAHGEN
jgi:hypothetical protein